MIGVHTLPCVAAVTRLTIQPPGLRRNTCKTVSCRAASRRRPARRRLPDRLRRKRRRRRGSDAAATFPGAGDQPARRAGRGWQHRPHRPRLADPARRRPQAADHRAEQAGRQRRRRRQGTGRRGSRRLYADGLHRLPRVHHAARRTAGRGRRHQRLRGRHRPLPGRLRARRQPPTGFTTVKDIVDAKRPIKYGTTGVGTGSQLSQELLFAQADIDATAVPFDGGAPALTAVLGGQVDVASIQLGEAKLRSRPARSPRS